MQKKKSIRARINHGPAYGKPLHGKELIRLREELSRTAQAQRVLDKPTTFCPQINTDKRKWDQFRVQIGHIKNRAQHVELRL
jgi:hypothetical protein